MMRASFLHPRIVSRVRLFFQPLVWMRTGISASARAPVAGYADRRRQRSHRGAYAFGLVVIPLIMVSGAIDVLEAGALVTTATLVRAGMVVLLAGLLGALGTRWGAQHPRYLGLSMMIVVAVGMELLVVAGGATAGAQHHRLNLLILGSAVLLHWSSLWMLLGSAVVMAVSAAAVLMETMSLPLPGATIASHFGYLLASTTAAVVLCALREAERRKDFVASRELAASRRKRFEQERRYRSLFETAASVIVVLAPDLRVLEFNPAAEELFGRSRDQVLGRTYTELFVPPEAWTVARAYADRVLSGQQVRATEGPVRRPDGTRRIVLWRNRVLRNADGDAVGVLAVGQDITERQQAERALRLSEARLRRLVETTCAVPWEADASTWQFTYVGPQAAALLGYAVERWYEPGFWLRTIHPDDREYAEVFCRGALDTRDEYEFEYRMVALDGRIVWVQDLVTVERADGTPVALRGFMLDITERKAAEQALRESEDQLRRLVESTNAVLCEAEAASRNVIYIGPQIEKILGYPVERWYEPGFWTACMHPDDRPWAAAVAVDGTPDSTDIELEYRLRAADGDFVWVREYLKVECRPGHLQERFRGVLVDVTDRKHAEDDIRRLNEELQVRYAVRTEELATSEDRFRRMFEAAPIGIAMLSDDGTVATNPAFQRMLGYADGTLSGKSVEQLTHPDDVAMSMEILADLRAGRSQSRTLEKRYLRADGSPVWARVGAVALHRSDGSSGDVFAMMEDVTRRRHRRSVEAGERRAYEVLMRTGLLAQALEALIGEIETCEPDMRCAVRVRSSAGTHLEIVAAPAVREPLVAAARRVEIGPTAPPCGRAFHSGERVTVDDLHRDASCAGIRGAAARFGLNACWSQPVSTPGGDLVGTLVVFHAASRHPNDAEARLLEDVAHVAGVVIEIKQIHDLLSMRQAQLAQAGRIGLIAALSAGIAHELHQPLTAIVNYAGAAERYLGAADLDRDAIRYLVGQMRTVALRGGETIRRIREFQQTGVMRREWVDVNDLVRNAVRMAEFEARRHNVAVRLALCSELPIVQVDGIQIEQVILNLVSNGIAAMSQTIDVGRDLEICSRLESDRHIEIAVRDRGPGLPAGSGQEIFEPPFSLSTSLSSGKSALGFGLAICQAILEAHDGRMWAVTNPDGGATVGFTLPLPVTVPGGDGGRVCDA